MTEKKHEIDMGTLDSDWLGEDRREKEKERLERIRELVRWRMRERRQMKSTPPAWVNKPDWSDDGNA